MYSMLEATSVKEINTGEGDKIKIIKATVKSVARYIGYQFKAGQFQRRRKAQGERLSLRG